MNISHKAVPFILFQRTQLDSDGIFFSLFAKLGFKIPALYNTLVQIRSVINRRMICKTFTEAIQNDFNEIEKYLPETQHSTIVDIGSGIGGIDVLLNRHYGSAELFLVDRTQTDRKVWYGYKQMGSFYNDLSATKEFLSSNGVRSATLMTPDEFNQSDLKVDIVISFISWGFHYPLETYLAKVKDILKPGGILIIDVRNGKGGEETLRRNFQSVLRIGGDAVKSRLLLKN
jgi:SAM-dependent methyltransferase